jgi:hypothetical protein
VRLLQLLVVWVNCQGKGVVGGRVLVAAPHASARRQLA